MSDILQMPIEQWRLDNAFARHPAGKYNCVTLTLYTLGIFDYVAADRVTRFTEGVGMRDAPILDILAEATKIGGQRQATFLLTRFILTDDILTRVFDSIFLGHGMPVGTIGAGQAIGHMYIFAKDYGGNISIIDTQTDQQFVGAAAIAGRIRSLHGNLVQLTLVTLNGFVWTDAGSLAGSVQIMRDNARDLRDYVIRKFDGMEINDEDGAAAMAPPPAQQGFAFAPPAQQGFAFAPPAQQGFAFAPPAQQPGPARQGFGRYARSYNELVAMGMRPRRAVSRKRRNRKNTRKSNN